MLFKLNKHHSNIQALHGLDVLAAVTLHGNNVATFDELWTLVPRGMEKPPDRAILEYLYKHNCRQRRSIGSGIHTYRALAD